MNWNKTIVLAASLFAASFQVQAQDNLINALKANQNDNSKSGFTFTEVINLGNTSIKNQGSSGTCWSYSGNSFLESEMIRMGKKPVEISQIYTARNTYLDKARTYVRLHGGLSLGEGGQFHDVLNSFRKYGTMPQSAYTGLHYGTTRNNFGEMTNMLDAMLGAVVKGKTLTPNWEKAYTAAMDSYLGEVPEKFDYNGKSYTPRTFADQVIGINPDDYVGIASVTDHPYYSQFVLLIPDNWSFDRFYNVKMNDLTDIIDNALQKGYTVAWATDVSEKGFSWKNGVAYVPEKPFEEMTDQEKSTMFVGPKPELKVTAEERQKAFDNWQTTDDHGMHIVGLVKDQNGKEYYIVKNSWGTTNDYHGYLYASKEFVRYKTTSLMLHKDGLTKDLKSKINIK
ncbi:MULTISPECIES: aminopeptidase C [Sphingobacterium]|jgi:bleomycin hydrolase|uniref:Aminopeptidase n=3 Tax=Sphingobacterium TaxID=28453 RepID=A0A420G3P5_9SPHI|nr:MULTISPECIES: C1 family peptidase [Sphingobacterium]HAF34478.1 aminopeptidase [Sphingobacterium sp.]QQT31314.1 aminopeptidase [Sphingobacterium multivorum]QQT52754.1 aminopeptidase [Sphingobacterium multivorum]QRY57865.1 aminopeptidase [Sphingobacterium siyangense]RKF39770.1 aminopeptidase [Sphingobacterium siyangense]